MKCAYVWLRAVEGKSHSPGIDLEMGEAEYKRLSAELRETHASPRSGSQVKWYTCHKVRLHLDEIQLLIDGDAFPPAERHLK